MSMDAPRDSRDPRLLRVSHGDRDRVVEILRVAAGDGRLEPDELEERVEKALQARTFAELEPLTEDLPVDQVTPAAVARGAGVGIAGGAGDGVADSAESAESASWQVHGLPMRREGAWIVPRLIDLSVSGGTAHLDYTLARLPEGGASTIRVSVHGGSVRLLLPPGIAVDATGVKGYGGSVRDRSLRRVDLSVPVTHVITVTGSLYGGSVRIMAVERAHGVRRQRVRDRRAERRRLWYGGE